MSQAYSNLQLKEIETARGIAREIVTTFMSGFQDCIVKAGGKLVEFLDSPIGDRELVIEESGGWFNRHVILNLEKVGRGQLVPQLTYLSGAGYDRLKRLPIGLQQKYLTEGVEVLIANGAGDPDTITVQIGNLSPQQAAQVFDIDSVRGEGAQRAWIESERTRAAIEKKPDIKMGYRIKGKTVTFLASQTFTDKELLLIVAEMR